MSLWKSEQGRQAAGQAVAQHSAAADPHPQYDLRLQHNLSASAPPSATDDAAAGYEPRSLWFDVAEHEIYRCMDATAGAAVWVKTTLTLDELGSAATAEAGDFDAAGSAAAAVGAHEANPDPHAQYLDSARGQASVSLWIRDPLRAQVEATSGGRATVHYTAKGQPSFFHVVPKFLCEDIVPGGELGSGVHPAFLFDGVERSEIFVGMYQMSEVAGEGVSQPMANPRVSINWDASRSLIQSCGPGFDMMSVWDWAAVVFWMRANGFDMRGNTNHGRHHDRRWETGRRQDNGVPGNSGGVGNILTGSGPNSWRHDNSPAGIADMVGNVWEWLLGCKMVEGRIFLAADNGIGAEAGWADTGWNMPTSRTWATIDAAGAGVDLKRSLIVPNGAHDPVGNYWGTLTGERFPIRGGDRRLGANAGPAALDLNDGRTYTRARIGSRPRFRNP